MRCLHCGHEYEAEGLSLSNCPKCGREPDPPLEYLADLARQGELTTYLED
jgi:predicted  nucleic acid-binding Zn-ribbon protein